MSPTAPTGGMIFTAIDTDADNIEAWNRWYDLEHLPPNIALAEVKQGRRYVAPPELHALRRPAQPRAGFANGQGVFVTIYLTTGDPTAAIAAMTEYRDVLVDAGRMDNAGNRTVRTGDAMDLTWAVADPALRLDADDVPFVAHSGLRVVLRTGEGSSVGDASVQIEGVHAALSFRSRFFEGLTADLFYLEGDTAEVTERLRAGAPYPGDAEVVLDAPFDAIVPFCYDFADAIRASDLPQTIDTDKIV
ncbi:MAG: hypothetical protein HKN26_09835 [Acidimicrobiales bacterium]|nr:hypothetical protein [Acidimicrobiales bacterium]